VASILHPSRPPSPGKHDAAVESYLTRARRRIRGLDFLVGLLVLASGVLAFLVGMVLCDRWLVLSPLTRQLALAGFGLAALLYVAVGIVRPLCRPINPYFAARHLEQVVPGSKNSVVNWLDLHDRGLPPAIRMAVTQRAARDLANADLEQAISGRRATWLGGLTTALALAAVFLMAFLGATPFFSLLGRTFAPFREGAIATRTQLTLVQPEGGNVTVPVGRSVRFAVDVDGRVPQPGKPDAVRLLFHYQPGDPDEERPLEREDGDRWGTTLPAFQVQNGFWYRIAGGDARTPEYRVQVRATPLITTFDVTYHYRPYLGWKDDTTHDPHLRALRGTEVTLVAHTNRTVRLRDSQMELELTRPAQAARVPQKVVSKLPAEAVPGDPNALAFHLVLEESGKYRVWFTSTEGEPSPEPTTYSIQVLQDHAPLVELTKPGKDVSLPANGLLPLEGRATDDNGLTSLVLHLRPEGGTELRPQPYRTGKSFRLADGGYPKMLEYRDFVDLARLKQHDGKPVALAPKSVLEYWLEVADDCDYPGPNVGRSKTYKVTIVEPDADRKKQEDERQKAQQDQQKHDAKQDEQLKKEGQNQRPDTNPDHQQQNQPGKEGEKPGQKQQPQAKQGGQPNEKQDAGQKPNEQPQAGQNPKDQPSKEGGKEGAPKPSENSGQKDHGKEGAPKSSAKPGQDGGKSGEPKPGPGQQGSPDPRQQQAERLAKAIREQQRQDASGGKNGPAQEPKGPKKDGGRETVKPDAEPNQGSGQAGEPKPAAGQPKEQGGSPTKPGEKNGGTPGGTSKNEGPNRANKPTPEKGGAGGTPQGTAKEQAAGKDPSEANARDVQGLEKQLSQSDAQGQKAAEKRLEQVRDQARDPAAREAARKALEKYIQEKKMARPRGEETGPNQPSNQGGAPGQGKKDSTGSKEAGHGAGQDAKGGNSTSAQAAGSQGNDRNGKKEGEPPGPAGGQPGHERNGRPGETAGGGTGGGAKPGGNPQGGNPARHASNNDTTPPDEPSPDGKANPNRRRQPGELVLQDLRKTLDYLKKHPEKMKEVLKRSGLKAKDVRDVEDYLNEKLPPPQQGGPLKNIGVRKVSPGKGTTPDTRTNSTAGPPPEFRESTRAFTRQLSGPDKE
jgi:hypothetical protein